MMFRCDFEVNFCNMTAPVNLTATQFQWIRNTGHTPSMNTGYELMLILILKDQLINCSSIGISLLLFYMNNINL